MKIRDVIRWFEADGWYKCGMSGSHIQFKRPAKYGLVTVAGPFRRSACYWYSRQHSSTSGDKEMEPLIVVEKTDTGFSAYSPDVPGCVSTLRDGGRD